MSVKLVIFTDLNTFAGNFSDMTHSYKPFLSKYSRDDYFRLDYFHYNFSYIYC